MGKQKEAERLAQIDKETKAVNKYIWQFENVIRETKNIPFEDVAKSMVDINEDQILALKVFSRKHHEEYCRQKNCVLCKICVLAEAIFDSIKKRDKDREEEAHFEQTVANLPAPSAPIS